MARQKSPFPFEGCIGDLLFYTTKAGFAIVQGKGGPSARRVREAPEYARTRENASEFGRASATAALLRRAVATAAPGCEGRGTQNRLVQALVPLVRADVTRPRGLRQLEQPALDALIGFEWNTAFPVGDGLAAETGVVDGAIIAAVPDGAPLLRRGGVLTWMVISFAGRELTRPVATDRIALLPGQGAWLSCPLPVTGLCVAGLALTGPEGGGLVLL